MKKVLVFLLLSVCFVFADDQKATEPAKESKKDIAAKRVENSYALIKTSKGDILVELFMDAAPETVKNFLDLAEGRKEYIDVQTKEKKKGHFYDGLLFHRCIKEFMIQGGDPTGTGAGGPGYRFADEIDPYVLGLDKETVQISDAERQQLVTRKTYSDLGIFSQQDFDKADRQVLTDVFTKNAVLLREKGPVLSKLDKNTFMGYRYTKGLPTKKLVKGSLAMANAGPNTNGSQFFINVVDTPHLDGLHTNFGQVLKGIEVAIAISEVSVSPASKPLEDVLILSIREISASDKDALLGKP